MTSKSSSAPYSALPSHPVPQNVIVLSYYHPPPNPSLVFLRRCIFFTFSILLLSAALFFLYPSDPTLQVTRIRLNNVHVNSSPTLTLDLSFSVVIMVRNRDFFSLDYDSLDVSVGYRGRELGLVHSQGGKVRARGSSYVNATLDLNGLQIIHDVFYLIEDLARGVIPFDTDTKVKGDLGLLFFNIPIKAKVSCEVYVNTNNQTIVRQDCYPEYDRKQKRTGEVVHPSHFVKKKPWWCLHLKDPGCLVGEHTHLFIEPPPPPPPGVSVLACSLAVVSTAGKTSHLCSSTKVLPWLIKGTTGLHIFLQKLPSFGSC